jgi:hypothetical protein
MGIERNFLRGFPQRGVLDRLFSFEGPARQTHLASVLRERAGPHG